MPEAQSPAPDIKELMSRRMTAAEAATIITAAPVHLTGVRKSLKEWLESGMITIDYAGVPHWNVDVNGKVLTVEASAAAIGASSALAAIHGSNQYTCIGGLAYNDATVSIYRQRRIGRKDITCTAGGDAAYTELVPAVAGYYGVLQILSLKTSIASAAATCSLTWESPAATPALPTAHVMPVPLAANVVYDNIGPLTVTHATLVDNQAIGVVLTDFGAPSAAIVHIEYLYWYET